MDHNDIIRNYNIVSAKGLNVGDVPKEVKKGKDIYKDQIIGNPWAAYYYTDGNIYYRVTDFSGTHSTWSIVYLSDLRASIERKETTSDDESIKEAYDFISKHYKVLERKERKHLLNEAMKSLQKIDKNAEWIIMCDGEEVKSINKKQLTLKPIETRKEVD